MLFPWQSKDRVENSKNPCMNCGGHQVVFTKEKVRADFDKSLLPADVQPYFFDKDNGVCLTCGIFQSFNRPPKDAVDYVNKVGKDASTTWDGMRKYPVPDSDVAFFEDLHFKKRMQRWDEYFTEKKVKIKKALIIRTWFGASSLFLKERFNATVSGLDMSNTCIRTTQDRVDGFDRLEGMINHTFSGPFLETGPYDAVFIFHVLTHSTDIHLMLSQLKDFLKPGGFIMLTHETTKKPSNPFHMIHLGELQLKSLLLNHFARVDRIDDCGNPGAPGITPYTVKHDEPDFVAWRS